MGRGRRAEQTICGDMLSGFRWLTITMSADDDVECCYPITAAHRWKKYADASTPLSLFLATKTLGKRQPALCLRSALLPLARIESQPIVFRRKRDLGALGEVKYIPFSGVHFLPRLVADVEVAFEDDLHLIVCVLVY